MKTTALFLLVLTAPASASAAIGEWSAGQRAEVRLVAAGIDASGKLAAGIEIQLPDGWTTYWRSPGDAGIAPLFDFTSSKNVAATDVSFPVPTRTDDGADTITNTYAGRVLFPVSVAASDRTRSVDLALILHIGVCDEICVPEDVSLSLTVPPGENDTEAAALLATARALVPAPAEPGTFALDRVTREGGTDGRPVFRFEGKVPGAAGADFFVEGPADWSPYTPEFVGTADKPAWTVKFSRTGAKTPIPDASFRVTIRAGDRAIDQTLRLE